MADERFSEETKLLSGILNYLFIIPVILFCLTFFSDMFQVKIKDQIPLMIVAVVFALIPLLFGKMVTLIHYDELVIHFGYVGLIKKVIPLSQIANAEIVEFNPLRDFGGWGIRCGKFRGELTGCYTLSGNRGILLTLNESIGVCFAQTKRIIIASKEPDQLIEALWR
ncbi:MAG: hypothetical protein A2Y62_16280 [Candidatus Fischerbacteria bacterium RBG_13_37_8]|uniref:Bacterial Pleckstrin homology domain-containing protein n=1 Tax=Candidatus Fischerbacteria bacterium RBG_13_37_8 TaxID=1817863 RepID=A0A1F5VVN5_9BACT|nr:MAG: hypothetical protein A2Y62_16280 [Candidatus Fischerbacteria bacterium RBG_13_37_8]